MQTKKQDAVYLHLTGPKGRFAQGRIAGLGLDARVDGEKPGMDVLHLKFRSSEDLQRVTTSGRVLKGTSHGDLDK